MTPTAKQGEAPRRANLIVAQRKFNRWYVYFKGVAPKDNVGCITDCTCEMHNGDEKLNICEPLYKH
jgi:hypothetical protein